MPWADAAGRYRWPIPLAVDGGGLKKKKQSLPADGKRSTHTRSAEVGTPPLPAEGRLRVRLQAKDRRVQKILDRYLRAPAWRWQDIEDPRGRRGRRWELDELLSAVFAGLLSDCATLREVEQLTEEMGSAGRQDVRARVPDSTLWDLLCGQRRRRPTPGASVNETVELIKRPLAAEGFRRQLRRQVRALWRRKALAPQALPCGVVAIDGKGLGALEHDAEGQAQKGHRADGSPYWLARVLRAVLISAASTPVLDQLPIGARTNEMGSFAAFFADLRGAYDALFEVVTTDAGMTSKANADVVAHAHKGYVMALKDNQPELMAEAKRLLRARQRGAPEAESCERYRGKLVYRRLYRTDTIAGYHGWTHLRQAWLVEQTTTSDDGRSEVERRYFVTNLHRGRLTPAQVLTLIRAHWRIEAAFWALDVPWREDQLPWCTIGPATEVLGLMRLMAYNLVNLARCRSLRLRGDDGRLGQIPPWRAVRRWFAQAWRLDLKPAASVSLA
jgi:hypothetical protein